jgi:hypothetical protein
MNDARWPRCRTDKPTYEDLEKLAERWHNAHAKLLYEYEKLNIDNAQSQTKLRASEGQLEAYRNLKFPVLLRKMWSGSEVQQWLDQEHDRIDAGY